MPYLFVLLEWSVGNSVSVVAVSSIELGDMVEGGTVHACFQLKAYDATVLQLCECYIIISCLILNMLSNQET